VFYIPSTERLIFIFFTSFIPHTEKLLIFKLLVDENIFPPFYLPFYSQNIGYRVGFFKLSPNFLNFWACLGDQLSLRISLRRRLRAWLRGCGCLTSNSFNSFQNINWLVLPRLGRGNQFNFLSIFPLLLIKVFKLLGLERLFKCSYLLGRFCIIQW